MPFFVPFATRPASSSDDGIHCINEAEWKEERGKWKVENGKRKVEDGK